MKPTAAPNKVQQQAGGRRYECHPMPRGVDEVGNRHEAVQARHGEPGDQRECWRQNEGWRHPAYAGFSEVAAASWLRTANRAMAAATEHQALDRRGDRDAGEPFAALLGQAPEACALGTDDERDTLRQRLSGDRLRGGTVEAEAEKIGRGQRAQGAGDIDDTHHRHRFQRARRRLGEYAELDRGVPILHHDGRRGEGGGGTQHGADVARVARLVKDNDQRFGRGCKLRQEIVEGRCRQRRHGDRKALMHRALRQEGGQHRPIDNFDRGARYA